MQTHITEKEIVHKEKLSDFYDLLEASSISEKDKKSIKFTVEFMQGKHNLKLSTRSFVFYGEPGVGKTYLVERLLKVFDVPVIFFGCAEVKHPNLIQCDNLQDVIKEIKKHDKFIVFLDDLSYIFRFSEYVDEISANEKQQFMKITDLIKNNDRRAVLFVTTNNINYLDDSILDRLEAKVEVDIPSEENKLKFLVSNYSDTANLKNLRYLSKHSIGYNYRDLPEMIKIAYRDGNGAIKKENLRNAMKEYIPTSLNHLKVIPCAKVNFGNIIGREKIKNILKNIISSCKNPRLVKNLGLKRHNLFIFEGPSGTGKTFMVKALAGELKFPIIHYKATYFARWGAANTVDSIRVTSKRFKNCIIFIDEADKLIGKQTLDEEGAVDGHLNEIFDGLDSIVNSLIVVAVNNIDRFGIGLQDRFVTIKFEMPNYQERLEFCRRKLESVKRIVQHNINLEEVARITSEMSFRDIEKMWNEAFYKYLEKGNTLTTGIFTEVVNSMRSYENHEMIYG